MAADTLTPDPEMTIVQAAGYRMSWLETLAASAAADGTALRLDLGGVTDFDSSGVQLLVALRRSLADQGRGLVVTRASAAVSDALATFGLGGLISAAAAA